MHPLADSNAPSYMQEYILINCSYSYLVLSVNGDLDGFYSILEGNMWAWPNDGFDFMLRPLMTTNNTRPYASR